MPSAYKQVGVLAAEDMPSFGSALGILRETFSFPSWGRPVTEFGLYASVLNIGRGVGLAVSTDGVGTKLLVAQELGKYDTVGIDCVAMNANDVVCVGAEPLAMVDYVAVQTAEGDQLRQIAIGLREGARQASISVPGGETAQIPEMLHAAANGEAFDLVGTCVGIVDLGRVLDGSAVKPGDALVGFASSGIHSNGLTLARQVFQHDAGAKLSYFIPEFQRTLGEELLEPSRIYVALAMALLKELDVRALAHITSDGFLNLRRVLAPVGFDIESVPPIPPVFELIQRLGSVAPAEMWRVYNMGTGFCAVVPAAEADRAITIANCLGVSAWRLGSATDSSTRLIRLLPYGIEGDSDHFVASPSRPGLQVTSKQPVAV